MAPITVDGQTPIHIAVIYHCRDIFIYLATKYPTLLFLVDDKGLTPLHTICKYSFDDYRFRMLETACEVGSGLSNDYVNRLDYYNNTPLYYAATNECTGDQRLNNCRGVRMYYLTKSYINCLLKHGAHDMSNY